MEGDAHAQQEGQQLLQHVHMAVADLIRDKLSSGHWDNKQFVRQVIQSLRVSRRLGNMVGGAWLGCACVTSCCGRTGWQTNGEKLAACSIICLQDQKPAVTAALWLPHICRCGIA